MEIYLIRHTTPAIEAGLCYGQSDLDVAASFEEEAAVVRQYVPASIPIIYSSPLQRCSKLARHVFPRGVIRYHDDLKELHCGNWEMQAWDAIPRQELDPWMNDFVNVIIPGGESYMHLYSRTSRCFDTISREEGPIAIFTHGGVIRSILAYISGTELKESFNIFKLGYGCVVGLQPSKGQWNYRILSNPEMIKQ